MTAADLVAALQAPGPFTVFAPTNDASAKVASPVLNLLLSDPTALTYVLLYHVTGNRQDLRHAFATRDLKTVHGQVPLTQASSVSGNGNSAAMVSIRYDNRGSRPSYP